MFPALTQAQLVTMGTDINNNPTLLAMKQQNNNAGVRDFYNQPNPTTSEDCWKTLVSITETGNAFNGGELAGLTTGNQSRLQTISLYSAGGYNPSLADRRAFFNDVFSGAGGTTTRANLDLLWKRKMKRGERMYATLTAGVFTLGPEGDVTSTEVSDAFKAVP